MTATADSYSRKSKPEPVRFVVVSDDAPGTAVRRPTKTRVTAQRIADQLTAQTGVRHRVRTRGGA